MRTSVVSVVIGMGLILLWASPLAAEVVYSWEFSETLGGLSQSISSTDLINGFGVNTDGLPLNEGINESAIAPYTFGIIDLVNEVNSWLMNTAAPGCLDIIQLLPSDGFHPVTGNGMPDLVDGVPGAAIRSVLRDFGRAALVVRYGFDPPQDIGRLRVFAANLLNHDGRVFQYYDVYARTGLTPAGPSENDGFDQFFLVAQGVTSGGFGMVNKDVPLPGQFSYEASTTDVFDFDADILIPGCSDLRFVFYCVSNADGFFIDPWQGNANEGATYQLDCPTVEPEDTDGYKKAFEAPIIKEIDVFEPGPTPLGDIDYDDDRDLFDVAALQRCFAQDTTANGCYRFDYDGGLTIDLTDFGSFEPTITGPQ